jgi:hypothetical protein
MCRVDSERIVDAGEVTAVTRSNVQPGDNLAVAVFGIRGDKAVQAEAVSTDLAAAVLL